MYVTRGECEHIDKELCVCDMEGYVTTGYLGSFDPWEVDVLRPPLPAHTMTCTCQHIFTYSLMGCCTLIS